MAGGTGVWSASWRNNSSAVANSKDLTAWVFCSPKACRCSSACWWTVDFFGGFINSSSGLLEKDSEGLAGAVKFAAHGIGGLIGQGGHLVITHLFISHQQQQQTVFRGQTIQRLLNALSQLFGFQDPQRRIRPGG